MSEPREDVEALHEAIGPPHGNRDKVAAHIELDRLLARLEQTEATLVEIAQNGYERVLQKRYEEVLARLEQTGDEGLESLAGSVRYWTGRTEAAERALRDACDVAIWLSGLDCLRTNAEAWRTWEDSMRPKLHAAIALASGEGEER